LETTKTVIVGIDRMPEDRKSTDVTGVAQKFFGVFQLN